MTPSAPPITPQTTLAEVLQVFPGAQRALFRRYHIGGCSSCAFQPSETLEQLCQRNNQLDVHEVIAQLQTSHQQDAQMLLDPRDLEQHLRHGHPLKLLDIRTREEWEAVRLPQAVRMSQESMQEILGQWPRDTLLVICDHEGKQALDAAAYFQGQGFLNVKCLRGGIDAWSQHVDPSLPRYQLA